MIPPGPATAMSTPPPKHAPCTAHKTGLRHRSSALKLSCSRRMCRSVGPYHKEGATLNLVDQEHWCVKPHYKGAATREASPQGGGLYASREQPLSAFWNKYSGGGFGQRSPRERHGAP